VRLGSSHAGKKLRNSKYYDERIALLKIFDNGGLVKSRHVNPEVQRSVTSVKHCYVWSVSVSTSIGTKKGRICIIGAPFNGRPQTIGGQWPQTAPLIRHWSCIMFSFNHYAALLVKRAGSAHWTALAKSAGRPVTELVNACGCNGRTAMCCARFSCYPETSSPSSRVSLSTARRWRFFPPCPPWSWLWATVRCSTSTTRRHSKRYWAGPPPFRKQWGRSSRSAWSSAYVKVGLCRSPRSMALVDLLLSRIDMRFVWMSVISTPAVLIRGC